MTRREPYGVSPARLKRAFSAMLFLGAEFLGLCPRLPCVTASPLKIPISCLLAPLFALASNPLSGRFLPHCGKDDFDRRQHLLCSVSRSLFRSIGDCIDSIFSARLLTPKHWRGQGF